MIKRNKIIYWIATAWLALGMISAGILQIIKMHREVELINTLGYPVYLLPILGVCKIVGVIVILLPKLPLLKEWAYAGFFFNMTGAIISHLATGSATGELFPPLLLLTLILVSWYFRTVERKISYLNLQTRMTIDN